ncbi:hypothetical protein HU720_10650 [Pseudomonas sp. SWRI51]|uniref:hypothetical protein n=1 Tax=Pseudomonas sp. SWRI51 TaxID=2745491 RepID=UPI001645A6DA|nr:hypothetical protein [Pseudomonas sp. SWRI51]MBC3411760.1 hypothetical protein [Pseudomonas sp. SWRI51]
MDTEDSQIPDPVVPRSIIWWYINARFNGRHVDEFCASQWVGDHTGSDDLDRVHFDRVIEAGLHWEVADTVLSRPLMLFNSPYCSPGKVEVRRQVLSDTTIQLAMDLGDHIRSVREIQVVDRTANRYLFQEFHLDAFVGLFAEDGSVNIKVSKGSRFYMAYLGAAAFEPDEAAALGYRQRFEALPDSQRLVRLRHVELTPFNNAYYVVPAHFYVRKASDKTDWYWLYLARDDGEDGLLPTQRSSDLPASPINNLPSVYHYHSAGARNGGLNNELSFKDPLASAMDEFMQVLYPVDTLLFKSVVVPDQIVDHAMEVLYDYPWGAGSTLKYVPVAARQHASPLVKMVSGVRQRTLMSVMPHTGGTLSWTFQGKAHGALDPHGDACWYCPPDDPGVPHDTSGKTWRACMYKTSGFSPVVIDKVVSGTPGNPVMSTYVVLNASPTHYLRVDERGYQVGLTLCYLNRGGEEVVVAPADIEWRVLDGGGVMDASGAFTPGSDQPFSVVLAIEKDDRRLYWAVIILPLPLKSVREFVTMSNKVS